MLFRQLVDLKSSTYTYLLADEESRDAVLIDPVFEQAPRDVALLRELGLVLRFTVDTHVHADHVTGAARLRLATGSLVAVAAASGASGADRLLNDGDSIRFGRHALRTLATPGHTDGCLSFVTDDEERVFTGDSLMIRAAGRTDFQQGDARRLYRSVKDRLFTLPETCLVYPGHDYAGRTVSTIAEERAWNPRLGGDRSEDDFVGYMANLGLPHPNQIAVAVPANLRCGLPEGDVPPLGADWGDTYRTFAGILEVESPWVLEHRGEVTIVDVREPSEWNGELGHIDGALPIPLGALRDRQGEIPRQRPVVVVCRSGARSAQATLILDKGGLPRVANLRGGMIAWRGHGYPATTG